MASPSLKLSFPYSPETSSPVPPIDRSSTTSCVFQTHSAATAESSNSRITQMTQDDMENLNSRINTQKFWKIFIPSDERGKSGRIICCRHRKTLEDRVRQIHFERTGENLSDTDLSHIYPIIEMPSHNEYKELGGSNSTGEYESFIPISKDRDLPQVQENRELDFHYVPILVRRDGYQNFGFDSDSDTCTP